MLLLINRWDRVGGRLSIDSIPHRPCVLSLHHICEALFRIVDYRLWSVFLPFVTAEYRLVPYCIVSRRSGTVIVTFVDFRLVETLPYPRRQTRPARCFGPRSSARFGCASCCRACPSCVSASTTRLSSSRPDKADVSCRRRWLVSKMAKRLVVQYGNVLSLSCENFGAFGLLNN